MSELVKGGAALDALNQSDDGGNDQEFASFKSGTTYTVKVLGTSDLIQFFSYGIFKKVNSFVAKNPSKKSAKGYPVENLTPWDKAWKYHKDLSEDFNDKHGQEVGKYRVKQRFAFGFIDLDSGEPIIVDVSKNQGQAIYAAVKKYEKKLDKLAFELSKQGESTSTTVSLTPIIDMDEDLTDEQRKNFDNAPKEFDMSLFDGLLYEADEAEQIELLKQAGFDVSLIGFNSEGQADSSASNSDEGEPIDGDVDSDDLPF